MTKLKTRRKLDMNRQQDFKTALRRSAALAQSDFESGFYKKIYHYEDTDRVCAVHARGDRHGRKIAEAISANFVYNFHIKVVAEVYKATLQNLYFNNKGDE